MFTGIISAVGALEELGDLHCRISCPDGWLGASKIGDSIAVNGICLTVTARTDTHFDCDVSAETRRVVAPLAAGQRVNLEHPVAMGAPLGGHVVSGHVDGTAEVAACTADDDGGMTLRVTAPENLLPLIVTKGSVALAGVSLTVNEVFEDGFQVYILPHTLVHTNLQGYPVGSKINLETDIFARHIARLMGKDDA